MIEERLWLVNFLCPFLKSLICNASDWKLSNYMNNGCQDQGGFWFLINIFGVFKSFLTDFIAWFFMPWLEQNRLTSSLACKVPVSISTCFFIAPVLLFYFPSLKPQLWHYLSPLKSSEIYSLQTMNKQAANTTFRLLPLRDFRSTRVMLRPSAIEAIASKPSVRALSGFISERILHILAIMSDFWSKQIKGPLTKIKGPLTKNV